MFQWQLSNTNLWCWRNTVSSAYQQAGVNIRAGDEAVERIKIHARSTHRPEVLGGLGGFGGLFVLNVQKYREPILVSGTDGVGTKLKLAFELDHHETVGIDLVAMCVNDILVSGAEPLYFLDYIACEKLEPKNSVVLAPDIGSVKMSQSYAKTLGMHFALIDKRRFAPNEAENMPLPREETTPPVTNRYFGLDAIFSNLRWNIRLAKKC